LISKHLK